MKNDKETILHVADLVNCRTFYSDIIADNQIIVDGSFLVKMVNEESSVTLHAKHPLFPNQDNNNSEVVKIVLTSDLMNETYHKLQEYKVKIFSVHYKDNNETLIDTIECCDPEENLLIIKSKDGFSLRKSLFFSKTQVLKI